MQELLLRSYRVTRAENDRARSSPPRFLERPDPRSKAISLAGVPSRARYDARNVEEGGLNGADVSGSTPLKKRKHGGPLYAELKDGDCLIASKLDRVLRSAEDPLVVARELQERGVSLVLADLGTEPVTGNGVSKLFFTLTAAIAEFERGRIVERMNDARKRKLSKRGHIGGDAPYGYRTEGKGKAAMLVEVPEEQRIVKRIPDLHAKGNGYNAICRILFDRGILNRIGNAFQSMRIIRIVKRGAT